MQAAVEAAKKTPKRNRGKESGETPSPCRGATGAKVVASIAGRAVAVSSAQGRTCVCMSHARGVSERLPIWHARVPNFHLGSLAGGRRKAAMTSATVGLASTWRSNATCSRKSSSCVPTAELPSRGAFLDVMTLTTLTMLCVQ